MPKRDYFPIAKTPIEVRVLDAIQLGMKVTLRAETETEMWSIKSVLKRMNAPERVSVAVSPSGGR